MNDALKYALENLDMIDNQGNSTGLVAVKSPEELDFASYEVEEIIWIENARSYGAHYLYFRRFTNRPPVPQVYIYDYTSREVDEEELVTLHQRLYSSGHVPMFFVLTFKDVRIFNCYDRPAKGNKLIYKPLTLISLAARVADLFGTSRADDIEKFKAFSGKSFDNGSFWENSPFSKDFLFANSAYEKLLGELKKALADIISKNILPAIIARKVMVIAILVKYLEERRDENNNSVFPKAGEERISIVGGRRKKTRFEKNFFDQFSDGANCFSDVLKKKGAGSQLFNYLADHFNGGVFKLTDKEKALLEKIDLTRFALFLEGRLDGIQYVFWRLYSFNDLPVELISNIYEEFLEKKPGVVYTPPYLVNFLLDETLPLNLNEVECKILDPACGSGVFLVGAYRRLIYRWRKSNGWQRPSLAVLKKILRDNIYGSDKDPDAVNLTIFSLSLALCDELSPLEIWEKLEFDELSENNIINNDFFSLLGSGKFPKDYFDLVIGNPPFEAKLTKAAAAIETQKRRERIINKVIGDKENKVTVKLPDNQIALLFLEQAVQLCKRGKLTCLIQPSGPLLYNIRSADFRQSILQRYNIPQIVDFTHLSRVLFGKNGDVATAAVFVKNEPATKHGLWHLTVRRTKTNKEKIYIELDNYDFHFVPRHLALNDYLIWKSNYLGGSRVYQLLKKFDGIRTLGRFLEVQKKTKNWIVREGYKVGKADEIAFLENAIKDDLSGKELARYESMQKKYTQAPSLTGNNTLAVNGLTEEGIDRKRVHMLKEKYFLRDWVRQPQIFEPPHLLIGEVAGRYSIPVAYSDEYCSFNSQVIGIHGKKDTAALQDIFLRLKKNKFYLFYLAGVSGRYMVNKSTSLLKGDIDKLPYPDDISLLALNNYEKMIVDDVVDYLIEFKQNGENSVIAAQDATKDNLLKFGEVYCSVINSVYNNLKPYQTFETASFLCYPFFFGEQEPCIKLDKIDEAENYIAKLVEKISGTSLRLTRIIRMYDQNIIYIIKPKKLRYWLPSIALRDADETFTDLRKQGY